MLPGDRLICAFVNQQLAGYLFKDWPVHITIVPWFRLDINSAQLAKQLQARYHGLNAFRVAVLGEAQFGYRKRKVVNLVSSPELVKLESRTRILLHAYNAWVVDEADNTRREFRPHVTAQSTGRVKEGDSFNCGCLYIVSQNGGYKQVEAVIRL